MRYVVTHPRRVRGEPVHQTSREKKLLESKENEDVEVRVRTREKARDPEALRKEIEEAYLMPEVEHFVETPEVKEIETRMELWLEAGYPVHLIGPTGCGKTSLAIHVARQFGRPVVWINGDESITTADLIGGYAQIENESVRDKYIHNVFKSKDVIKVEWVDNPLTLACKYGYTLIYNEFSRTKPAANNVFLSVFEEGVLELPTKFGEDRYIRVHPDFRAILTSNSIEYAGIHRPQDALLDRMVGIYTDYYGYETEVKIVVEHTGLPQGMARKVVEIVRYLRERLPEAQKPGTRACIMIGKGLMLLNGKQGIGLDQICIDVIASKTSSRKEMEEKRELVYEAISAVQGVSGG
ncbi:MAG: gas vesicle protein GvpN [Methanothrix sp.]|uniref:gas vesicle protein GvpN n=1 Tax=Methanothrix sp. TaxID=90426 RepID=UPI0025E21105|nr:gas vesicle protein GvpN [Methanothrix sp.]MCQ8902525.1 gas vesicle protein GvpN [Methanothrix sp.]